jgi:hypothetical protein
MRTLLFGYVSQCAILTARCQELKFVPDLMNTSLRIQVLAVGYKT